MSSTIEQLTVVDDALVDQLARAMVARDGDDWDDPGLTPYTPRSRAEEFRDSYRKAARDLLGDAVPIIRRRLFDQLREAAGNDADYRETYTSWWKRTVEDEDGKLILDQVMRELSDYAWMMGQVAEVYCHITGNRMSKPSYLASAVIAQADEYYNESYVQDLSAERKGIYEDLVAGLNAAGETRAAKIVRWKAANNPNGPVEAEDLVLATDLTQCGWRDPATGAIAACDPTDVSDPPADGWMPVFVEVARATCP